MLKLTGYQDLKKLNEGRERVLYSGLRITDQKPVVLKALRSEHPSPDIIALMYHEYQVSKDLKLPGIIQTYELIDEHNQYALVQEDMHGISLKDYLEKNPLKDLKLFFKLAIQMTNILGELHQHHIIHKDIKPSNFIIHPESLEIKLTDFNFSSKLLREIQDVVPPEKLEGTLAYMAPEQTGRMNMNIDYRSDFYALGATFYEMLTGHPPFLYTDPLELLHAHLANPIPDIFNASFIIPPILDLLVKKLMAKNPIDRYQSAIGLTADLERCQKLFEESGEIEAFPLGEKDVFDRLNLSQKLYGREREAKVLLEAYERVSQGAVESLMVCGYSGIGKTMLINEVHKPMVKHKGYFISGKFDQLQRNTPYTAITQAFNQLARVILAEPEDRFEKIKASIIEALGGVAQVIIDLAPDLELIIGPQPPLFPLSPQATQNRMMAFFKLFMETIASAEHPLVMFIDDLQWIDSGSLKLFEYILTDEALSHVLLIGAYRDNEVDDQHPLRIFLNDMQNKQKTITTLSLGPLTVDNFSALFRDSFNRDEAFTLPLAQLIHKRTEGNPFFCKQVISTIYQEKLLYFDYTQRQWNWKLEGIEELKITDNIVDLMLSKLKELPEETQSLLKYAACIGNRFSVEMLSIISGKSPEMIGKALWPALQKELIMTLRLGYKRVDAMSHESLAILLSKDIIYQFIHDRVQQAVYQGISSKEKEETHLSIARLLLQKDPEACKKERLFEVTDHFNEAHALLNPNEKVEVVNLNYEAAVKALSANAYQPMANYLSAALSLMNESWWENHRDLALKVNREYALSLFLFNKVIEAEKLTKDLLERAQTNMEKVSLYRIQILSYIARGELDEAFEVGQLALRLLGVNFVIEPNWWDILSEFLRVQWLMRRYHPEKLDEELPVLSDPYIIAAFEIINELSYSAFWKSIQLFVHTGLTAMALLLRYGKQQGAGWWAWWYGFVLLVFFKDVDRAFQYWVVAQKLLDQSPDKYTSTMAYDCAAYFLNHWRYHEKDSEQYYRRGVQDSIESGNILVSVVAKSDMTGTHNMALAKSLKNTIEGMKQAYKVSLDVQYKDFIETYEGTSILFENLSLGEHRQDEHLNELEKVTREGENLLMHTLALKMRSFYFYFMESYDKAIHYHKLWYVNESVARFDPFTPEVQTTNALAMLKMMPTVKGAEKRDYKKRIKKITQYVKWGAKVCPINYRHHYLFILGEQLRLKKRYSEALDAFNEAIENAKNGDYYLWVGLANELAADLLMGQNYTRCAMDYIREAHYYYNRYGITVKMLSLERRYPFCFMERSSERRASGEISTLHQDANVTTTTTSADLDFMSVIKASQTISGEIVLDKLFEKMLLIAIENAGAEKAIFLEQQKNDWIVTAALGLNGKRDEFKILNTSLSAFEDLPQAVIRFALRSHEPVVLLNAAEDGTYRNDPYILRTQPKSLLCLPIIHQDKVLGMIYLENNLTIGVFTKERVIVLTTLSSQIAISLQNARHFEQMEILYRSTEKFVPKSFLQLLKKEHVEDVKLGDSVEATITVLFTDIRDYTTITEKQTPKEAFSFINEYLKVMGPIIRKYHGFINQYQGDAIMALFPSDPADAVKAVIEMYRALIDYNARARENKQMELKVGYGLNTGLAMLGTIGEEERMDANVISDAVNLASRVEGLNKFYGTQFLISETTYESISDKKSYSFRRVDKVRVKGKKQALYLYEVYLNSPIDEKQREFIKDYEAAFKVYESGDFKKAKEKFSECSQKNPQDKATLSFIERCQELIEHPPTEWDGTYTLLQK